MSAGAQTHAAHGHFERSLTGFVERAEGSEQARGNAGVVESPEALNGACGLYTSTHFGGCCAMVLAAQFFVGDGGHFYVQIDAIEQRSTHFAQVALNDCTSAPALA